MFKSRKICRHTNCQNAKFANSKYCQDHKCQYCDSHVLKCNSHGTLICKYDGCKVDKITDKTLYLKPYCIKHSCKIVGCCNIKLPLSDKCSEHKCKYVSCSDLVSGMTCCKVCDKHKCSVSGCHQVIKFGYKICSKHTCMAKHCHLICKNYKNNQYKFYKYCNKHSCQSCSIFNSSSYNFCDTYRCRYDKCDKKRSDYNLYCKTHKKLVCKYVGCCNIPKNSEVLCREHRKFGCYSCRKYDETNLEKTTITFGNASREVMMCNDCFESNPPPAYEAIAT